ncbi:hypothetical protein BABINDRAFT_167558 [Babjeviella inositovora NRRL Y-12698]|uniref:Uncharacterized protein n=1 Tax=Babjeviella inositovora NRRL Y-12698 TaxID=984486 RepID=A0A1E3QMZ5_9ASCO|nr:uncharacterized protein BABINDRAFT_167558 [Babjeviella inositovora NRRL Y-12698]ODQ79010.1 hypothetical protein BABINDRAFT_167558 [Babjeviella inositovora NRRL Y-12698]
MSNTEPKRRLSFFSFHKKPEEPQTHINHGLASPSLMASAEPDEEFDSEFMFAESSPSSMIFERSVQDHSLPMQLNMSALQCTKCQQERRGSEEPADPSRSPTHQACGHRSCSFVNHTLSSTQDYIPPVLDATASILGSGTSDLDNVEMIYAPRRSSVMSLNHALGRTNSVSRIATNTETDDASSQINQSKSTLSFMSYNDMLENDALARRPSLSFSTSASNLHAVSPPFVGIRAASRTNSFSNRSASGNSNFLRKQSVTASGLQASLLSQQLRLNNKKKFMLSPETSDSENGIVPDDDEPVSFSPRRPARLERSASNISGAHSIASFTGEEEGERCSVGELLRRNTNEVYA